MSKFSKHGGPETREPVNSVVLREMFIILLLDPGAFQAADPHIKIEELVGDELLYGVVWSIWREYYTQYAALPGKQVAMAELQARFDRDPDDEEISDKRKRRLERFVQTVFAADAADLDSAWALSQLKLYLEDLQAEKLRRIFNGLETPANVGELLEQHRTQAAASSSLGVGEVEAAFPDEWAPQGVRVESSGHDFIDRFCGGGPADGEALLLYGPTGSCKTTLLLSMAYYKAQLYEREWAESPGSKRKMAVLFHYEDTKEVIRQRLLVRAADVNRERFQLPEGETLKFHDGPDWLPYERERFAAMFTQGVQPAHEAERVRRAKRTIQEHLIIFDMTGADKGRGRGGVPEVVALLGQLERQWNARIGFVGVDYADLLIAPYAAAQRLDSTAKRDLMEKAPFYLRTQVSQHFSCPTWLLQQLDAKTNASAAGYVPRSTDGANCKTMAFNADYSFAVGRPSLEGIAVIGCDKHRRSPPMGTGLIRSNLAYGEVLCADKEFMLDTSSRAIVRRENQAMLAEAERLGLTNAGGWE